MSALIKLRPYQTECLDALTSRWDGGDNRVASVLACGLGKTFIFTHKVAQWLVENPGKRALILASIDELIGQAYKSMRKAAPDMTVGIVKASRNETNARVIISSRQTLANEKRRAQIRNVGLIIVDECHEATRNNTYGKILEHFGAFDTGLCAQCAKAPIEMQLTNTGVMCAPEPKCTHRVKVAGFTATLVRGDKQKLAEVWQPGKTFTRDIAFGIRHGYLLDMKGKRVVVADLNLKKVKTSGGDYQDSSLADELERSLAPDTVAKAYVEHASDRLGIGFAPTISSAYAFAEAFNDNGIRSEVVHSNTAEFPITMDERRAILRRLHTGETRVVWSVNALTFGFDEPRVSCVVWARPTKQAHVYQQGVCRAGRPDLELPPDERGYALILDVVGSGRDHALSSLVDLSLPSDPYAEEGDAEEDEGQGWCFTHDVATPCLECEEEKAADSAAGFDVGEYVGPVEVVDFDPLARDSAHTWGKTDGGFYFLNAGRDALVFLVPELETGEYGVAWCTSELYTFAHEGCPSRVRYFGGPQCLCGGKHAGVRGGWANGHRNLSLEEALTWGVDVALEIGGKSAEMFTTKKKAWRKSKEISAAQASMCARLGIDITGMNKGEVSDAISHVKASRRIDPVVGALTAMMERDSKTSEGVAE